MIRLRVIVDTVLLLVLLLLHIKQVVEFDRSKQ